MGLLIESLNHPELIVQNGREPHELIKWETKDPKKSIGTPCRNILGTSSVGTEDSVRRQDLLAKGNEESSGLSSPWKESMG